MPRPAYIFLKCVLAFAAALLFAAWVLSLCAVSDPACRHTAAALTDVPAGVLLLGLIGLAILLDHS